jgi:hypothetical protein
MLAALAPGLRRCAGKIVNTDPNRITVSSGKKHLNRAESIQYLSQLVEY